MRLATLTCLLVSMVAASRAEARRLSPEFAYTATLQSDATGATAAMTWHTRRVCDHVAPFEFFCRGRWDCHGVACHAREDVYTSCSVRPASTW
jgi:hypothetical protein